MRDAHMLNLRGGDKAPPSTTSSERRRFVAALNASRHAIACRDAFTLIELLAAITILMIMVSIMAVIFTESNRAWKLGTGRAENNNDGRAAINAIAQDLQYAITEPGTNRLTFAMRIDTGRLPSTLPSVSYGFANSEICFVSLNQNADASDSSTMRSTREIYYWVREATADDTIDGAKLGRYELVRADLPTKGENPSATALHSYKSATWYENTTAGRTSFQNQGVIAENVTAFGCYAPNASGVITTNYISLDAANSNQLPEYVDVFLEVVSSDDAERLAELQRRLGVGNSKVLEFVESHAYRYTSRVFFYNRSGYAKRVDI